MLVGVYLDQGRVSDARESAETGISEIPLRHFKKYKHKLMNNTCLSSELHFQNNLSS